MDLPFFVFVEIQPVYKEIFALESAIAKYGLQHRSTRTTTYRCCCLIFLVEKFDKIDFSFILQVAKNKGVGLLI